MNNVLEYKGYYGNVEISPVDEIFFGRVLGINDHVTFEGSDARALREDFEGAVDDYLAACMEIGKEPERAYKGNFNVRIDPELHKRLTLTAAIKRQSLNSAVEDAIRQYVR